jgi:hypothetical protein
LTGLHFRLMALALSGVFAFLGKLEAQSQDVSALPRASRCSARAPLSEPGGATLQTIMRTSSSGGWCWFDVSATFGSLKYVGSYEVTQAPAHGEILMGEANQKARIAYKPATGFVGEDSFVIVNKMTHSERPVAVTVLR